MLGQTFSHLTDETDGSEMLIGGCKYEAFKFKFSNDDSCDKLRFDGFENFYWLRFSRLAKHVDVDNIDTKLKINDALGTSFINITSSNTFSAQVMEPKRLMNEFIKSKIETKAVPFEFDKTNQYRTRLYFANKKFCYDNHKLGFKLTVTVPAWKIDKR